MSYLRKMTDLTVDGTNDNGIAQTLDSTSVGNKFRYINHQADPYANCRAKILLCNTVHRIGMFACQNINVGDELLFDYGYEVNLDRQLHHILINRVGKTSLPDSILSSSTKMRSQRLKSAE